MEEKYEKFEKELTTIINKYSLEGLSNTPDYILAEYMTSCLKAFTKAVIKRKEWGIE